MMELDRRKEAMAKVEKSEELTMLIDRLETIDKKVGGVQTHPTRFGPLVHSSLHSFGPLVHAPPWIQSPFHSSSVSERPLTTNVCDRKYIRNACRVRRHYARRHYVRRHYVRRHYIRRHYIRRHYVRRLSEAPLTSSERMHERTTRGRPYEEENPALYAEVEKEVETTRAKLQARARFLISEEGGGPGGGSGSKGGEDAAAAVDAFMKVDGMKAGGERGVTSTSTPRATLYTYDALTTLLFHTRRRYQQ